MAEETIPDNRAAEPALKTKADLDREKFGKDISFGIQQTLACWATDFIDPFVGEKIQKQFETEKHHGSLRHTTGGEIVGDTAALFAFLGIQRFAPKFTEALARGTRKTFSRFFERTGHKELKAWAHAGHVAKDSPEYQAKLKLWKDMQADNMAKSSIISASSIALNVFTQRKMGNTHTLGVITLSKVAGALITMAAILGIRLAAPKGTSMIDEELNEKYFSPLIRRTQKFFGAKVDEKPVQEKPMPEKKSHAHRESERRDILSTDSLAR